MMAPPIHRSDNIITMDRETLDALLDEKIKPLQEEIARLKFELSGNDKSIIGQHESVMARMNRRLHILEAAPKEIPKEADAHLDKLQACLKTLSERNQEGISKARAAKALGVSKARVSQLMPLIRIDPRFRIIRDELRPKKEIIGLNKGSSKVKADEKVNLTFNSKVKSKGE